MAILSKSITADTLNKHLLKYSQNLLDHFDNFAHLLPIDLNVITTKNLYICPLCVEKYFIVLPNEINGNGEFSMDHLPPDSVGGTYKVITCKKCNNDSGGYEAELLRLVNLGSVPDRKTNSVLPQITVCNKQTDEQFKATVNKIDGVVNIQFNENAKLHSEGLKKFLTGVKESQAELQLFVPSPDFNKIEKALLKSAYLVCFVWWGYDFIYSGNGYLIRQVLKDQLPYPTRIPIIWREGEDNSLAKGVGILSRNNKRQAFVVTLELKSRIQKFYAVILIPGPGNAGWNKLYELDTFVKSENLTEFDCLTIPPTVRSGGYTFAWNIEPPNLK